MERNCYQILEELSDSLERHLKFFDGDTFRPQVVDRETVDKIRNLQIKIHPNDHNPPHFHVKSSQLNASFLINTCEVYKGKVRPKERKAVKNWYNNSDNQKKLKEVWMKFHG